MIRTLRKKFIIIAMSAIIVCTTLLVLSINLVNFYQMDREASAIVSRIAENNGHFPGNWPEEFKDGIAPRENDENRMPPDPWIRQTRELENETLFFVVHYGKNGEVFADTAKVQAVTAEDAVGMAEVVSADEGKETGYYDGYKYLIRIMEDGSSIVVFMDCESRLSSVKVLALISLAVEGIGILVMFLIIALYSKKAIQPVLESSEKQKQFITDASHELKTPLTVIATNMDILSMDLPENEWVEGTKKQVTSMRKLVNNMVSLSRLEEETHEMEAVNFDFSAAVEESAEPFVSMAEFQGKEFTLDVEQNLTFCGDENAIRQLLGILCDNAVKYAGGEGRINCLVKKKGKKIILDLSNDCDEAVEPAAIARLFDRFYRADPARSKEDGKRGYGIGLALAKAIVEKQGGKITAHQEKDLRMHFTVEL